jgi:hypothetical protein
MVVLVAVLAIFPLYSRLKVEAAPVPPGVRLGGLALSDMKDTAEIRTHLQAAYAAPIEVRFGDRKLALRPEDVNFYLDTDQMLAEAATYLDGAPFVDIAVRSALGLQQRTRNVPARYMLDTASLRSWLEAVAAEHNSEPQRARAIAPPEAEEDAADPTDAFANDDDGDGQTDDVIVLSDDEVAAASASIEEAPMADYQWVTGAPGYTLDVEASIAEVVAALSSTGDRVANLVLTETSPPVPTMADLERILDNQTMGFPGFAAVYVHDLLRDDEASVDADVSFSGMSTLKIGIAAAVMRKLPNGIQADDPVGYEVGQWLDYALGESNNYAANLLLRYIGDGNTQNGTRVFTDFMRAIGMESTYMQSGYDVESQLPEIPTPGNQQTEWDADPDTNLQSTPREMGRILSAIFECSENRGLLIETFPGEITPEECAQILFYMTHDQFREMVWGGLPDKDNRWILHKHGFAFESHSDVALVWGPNGPYVISIFLFRQGWMDWATSNSTMKKVSRITWNFFEFQRQQEEAANPNAEPPPPAPALEPPPGYVPINNVVPDASATQ